MSRPVQAPAPALAEHRSLTVDVRGRRLHLLDWPVADPAARTVLFVHGGCANAHWWCHTAAHLYGRYRMLALDLSGHGDSEPLSDGDYSLQGHSDDLLQVARHLDLRAFALVGHSFGAFVSLAAAPRLNEDLAALVLVDSRGHIRPRAARYLTALGKFANPVYPSRDEALRGFQLLPRQSIAAPEVLAHVAAHSIRRCDDGTWTLAFDRRALRASQAREFHAEMGELRTPVLLLRGSESTALSARSLRELAAEIAAAQSVEIAGAHHHVMLDRPAAFAAALDDFLRALPDRD